MKKLIATICLTLAVLVGSAGVNAEDLLLFGGPNHKEYIGCLKCNEFSSESVCNGFAQYGNEFGSTMWNEFSTPYGNEFSSSSPWNEFSTSNSVPVLVGRQGAFYGYFTVNDSRHDAVKFSSGLRKIFNRYRGDLEKVREALCAALN
jgi:hypothetical protein